MNKKTLGEILTIENGILLLGSILLFAKTTELMTAFAPKQIFGYTGIEVFYGMACAIMVEGLFVTMKFQISRSTNPYSWGWNLILIVIPFVISALAQAIDSFMIQKTLAGQPPAVQFLVAWGVPMVPALIVGLVLVRSVLESVPDEPKTPNAGQKTPNAQKQIPNADKRPWIKRLVSPNGHNKTEKEKVPNS
jgi:hypothetical protein